MPTADHVCPQVHRLLTSAQLRAIRAADPDGQGRHSFTAQQQTLRRLNVVFQAFYERVKKGKPGYPRFNPYSRFDQVRFVAGDGAKWTPASGEGWARAAFQNVGSVKVRQSRQLSGTVKALQIKREGRRWYVVVITEIEPVLLSPAGRSIGIDVGVARFLTTSDGEIVANPRFLAQSAKVIADLQHRKDHARSGSGNQICLVHGEIDADINGARNIASRAGLGSSQAADAA